MTNKRYWNLKNYISQNLKRNLKVCKKKKIQLKKNLMELNDKHGNLLGKLESVQVIHIP